MPKKAAAKRKVVRKKNAQSGEGIMDIFKSINKFLKKTKIISGLAKVASVVPGLGEIAAPVAGVAGSLGYGKRKKVAKRAPKKKGAGLNLPGQRSLGRGLNLPGKGSAIQVPTKTPYR